MSESLSEKHSSNIRDFIYGEGVPDANDPAENYHEASKLHRDGLAWETPMIPPLTQSPELQRMSQRSSRRYSSRPFERISAISDIPEPLKDALYSRRSQQEFGGGELSSSDLAAVLQHSYGSYLHGDQPRRNTPSGGALYPLDIYIIPRTVEGLASRNVYFYDPFRCGYSQLDSDVILDLIGEALLLPEAVENASAFLVISASFWRSRFKYSQRALRFCCQEAGHLAQNLLTVATSLQLQTRLFGGFIDDEVNAVLPGHNGIDESALYVIALGA